jgi:hypothetical protein
MARLRKVKEGIASQNKRRELQTLTRAYSQVHTHSGRERERVIRRRARCRCMGSRKKSRGVAVGFKGRGCGSHPV